jgi:hypothetical protein
METQAVLDLIKNYWDDHHGFAQQPPVYTPTSSDIIMNYTTNLLFLPGMAICRDSPGTQGNGPAAGPQVRQGSPPTG